MKEGVNDMDWVMETLWDGLGWGFIVPIATYIGYKIWKRFNDK